MKSKMNRALSMLFALVMVLTVFPVMTSTATAAESEAPVLTADDLYLTNGLVIWLDGEDASSVDLANNTWASKVGDVVATIGGTWKEGRNAGSYRFDIQYPGMEYGLFLPITALPTGDYTIDMLTMTRGYTVNGDGVTSDKNDGQYTRQASSFVIGPLLCDTFGQERNDPNGEHYSKDCAWNDAAWYYSDGHDLYTKSGDPANANWASKAEGYGWGTRNRAFTYRGDFPSSIVLTLDITGTTKAQYTFTQNGAAIHSFNGVAHSFKEIVPVDTSFMEWAMFRGFPVEIYQFRVYDHVLTQNELNTNHLADLAKYYDLDLTCLAGLSLSEVFDVAAALSSVGFDAEKAAVQSALNRASDLLEIVGKSVTVYDKLYAAQDNLIVLLSAFDAKNDDSVDVLGGHWYNKATSGSDYATLFDTTSAASWEYAKSGKGIEYGFNSIGDLVGNLYNIGMQLPTANFTDGDMAAEYVFAVNATLDENGNQVKIGYTKTPIVDEEGNPVLDGNGNPTYTESFTHGGKWGVYNGTTRSNFSFGGLQICHFVLTENPSGASMEDRVFYAPGPWEGGWTTTDSEGKDQRRYESTKLFGTASGWNTDIITLGFNRDVTEREDYDQADFAILINGAQKTATSNVKYPNSATQCKFYTIQQLNSWTANGAAGTAADAFFGVPATVYAIRVYNRALTDAERAQNYAVDLLAFFEIDITGIETLSLDEQAALVNELSRFSMNKGGKSEIQAIVSNAVAKAVPTAADMSVYDELYVTADLAALFTAFDAKGSGIDLAAGTWTDKKSGLTVILDDRTGAAEWNLGQNGMGVGYWFQSLKDLADSRYAIGMRLPTSVLTDGDLAVEYTYKPNPVEKPDGTQEQILKISGTQQTGIETTIGRYTYGCYNGDNSSFTFAGLQLCQFQWDNYDGASMTARAFYSNGSWGAMNSGTFDQPYLFGTKADGYSSDVAVLSIDRTVTEKTGEGEYNEASFVIYKNGASQTTVKNGGAHAKQQGFYTIEDLNASHSGSTAADAFYGVPATVYAIRIYTDDLTAAEKAQNYAVDLMAYFGLDVRGFAAAAEAKKTAVYEAFAAYTFNDADKVAEMQAAIDAAVAGIPVAEGVQVANDGTALRIWASMDTAENVSKLGLTVVFKKDGVVVSEKFGETNTAFESITSAGKTVTAEELRTELLYAAVVKGIPAGTYTVEVTPYVVMMDETTVTGETKTMDLTFGG